MGSNKEGTGVDRKKIKFRELQEKGIGWESLVSE